MLHVIKGSVVTMDTDAIVNAANTSLLGGSGVDGAIHRAAGPRLLEECRTIGGCNTGEAVITKGYRLNARYVIHTVGPVYYGRPQDARLLESCYRNCMDIAREHGIKSISFCCISTGVYDSSSNMTRSQIQSLIKQEIQNSKRSSDNHSPSSDSSTPKKDKTKCPSSLYRPSERPMPQMILI